MQEMKTPEYREKVERGPVVVMSVGPSGSMGMGRNLVLWFLFCTVVGVFAAYIAGRTFGPGAGYGEIFRYTGTVAFMGYAVALWEMPIWFHRSWRTTLTFTFDGLIYALLTGGVFGWLWPG